MTDKDRMDRIFDGLYEASGINPPRGGKGPPARGLRADVRSRRAGPPRGPPLDRTDAALPRSPADPPQEHRPDAVNGMEPIPTIAQAGREIAAGTLSPVSLVERCLARIESHDAGVNAFHDVFAADALAEARTAEAEIRAGRLIGPLHGIPIGIKAVIDIAGRKTTANSRLLPDYVPDRDATVVRLLREAGAIVLGHTDTFEFAFGGPTFDAL